LRDSDDRSRIEANAMGEFAESDVTQTGVTDHGRQPPTSAALALSSRVAWPAVAELTLVVLIHVAHCLNFVPFSKIPFLLVVGWISVRLRGRRWRDVGLQWDRRRWATTLLLGIVAGACLEAFQLFVSTPALAGLTGKQPDLAQYQILVGNAKLALVGIALAWVLAAFGEELVYRGYLMNRVAELGRNTRGAWLVSLLLISALFGFGHCHQGLTGVLEEGFAGLLLGLLYFATGRNLSVPIVAHGVEDTIDVVLLYFGCFPGM
jgi:membrane protease YdiL (CAAX protease family)